MLHLIQFVGGCSHDAGSVTDRPRGNNMYTILHFGSEATLEIEGEARQMTKDCFVIITPRTSYRYYNNDAAFTEDGIFFDGEIPFALIDELKDEKTLDTDGEKYSPEVLYWIGYLYRYWACTRGEKSKRIYRQAPAKTMKRNYMAFHTFDPDVAIDDLIEIHRQRQKQ